MRRVLIEGVLAGWFDLVRNFVEYIDEFLQRVDDAETCVLFHRNEFVQTVTVSFR